MAVSALWVIFKKTYDLNDHVDFSEFERTYALIFGALGRGLHSSTSQLNLSAFRGIGGALRGCVRGVQEVSGGIRGYLGYVLCQKRLKLS